MLAAGMKNAEVVDELESHLREDVARQVQSGESTERAFAGAVQRVGQASLLHREFAKLSGKKWRLMRKLKELCTKSAVPL